MSGKRRRFRWLPRIGWGLVILGFVAFVWGLDRRARLEGDAENIIRMLFVPSVEQGTLVRRGDELARFVRQDSGLTIRSEVPTSYAAVIQALGSGQADVAWMPAFAYVIAHARYGTEAKLQVVRSVYRYGTLVTRSGARQPESLEQLAGRAVAFPTDLSDELQQKLLTVLNRDAPGWTRVPTASSIEAVRKLVESPTEVDAAVSSWVFSGPFDLVGDGRKLLQAERPGTLADTRIIFKTEEPAAERATAYYGCVYTRVDSGLSRLGDLNGKRYAFSDQTSTSGHIFPRLLLNQHDVSLGRVYFAGGHPNVVQAVWDGKADAGSAYYVPPGEREERNGTFVGDARTILLSRMKPEDRLGFLDEVRIIALTDPIPNDVCVVRQGFPEKTWQTFAASLQRFLVTDEGRGAFLDLVAGIEAIPTKDSVFDGIRQALAASGMSAAGLLEAEEEKLKQRRQRQEEAE